MQKLKLDLDRLIVESFDTDASGIAPRGTVRAHSELCIPTAGEPTCGDTCDSCNGTCVGSCGGSCGCTNGYTCNVTCADPTCVTCLTNCQQDSCVETCP